MRGYFADLVHTRGPQNTRWLVRRSASPHIRRLPVEISGHIIVIVALCEKIENIKMKKNCKKVA